MKFKLDENIGRRGLELLKASGHDVMTVWDQGLHGVADERLFEICAAEKRVLITRDRDFGQVPRFPPERARELSSSTLILEPRSGASSTGWRISSQYWKPTPFPVHCGSSNRAACESTCARNDGAAI